MDWVAPLDPLPSLKSAWFKARAQAVDRGFSWIKGEIVAWLKDEDDPQAMIDDLADSYQLQRRQNDIPVKII